LLKFTESVHTYYDTDFVESSADIGKCAFCIVFGHSSVDTPCAFVRFARVSAELLPTKSILDHEDLEIETFMAKASRRSKYVYQFGNKKADGNGSMKPLLGGKGANLAEMSRIGLPVPPGFTITTEVCTYYYENKRTYPKVLEAQARDGMAFLEKIMGTKFGDKGAMPRSSPCAPAPAIPCRA
jgi:hypothetical protein